MPNQTSTAVRRHSRRSNQPEDPTRSDLLAKILEESSSISLNNVASQISAKQTIDSHARLFDLLEQLTKLEAPINPSLPSRSEQKWSNFFDWIDRELGAQDGVKLSTKIAVTKQDVTPDNDHVEANGHKSATTSHLVGTDEHCLTTKVPFKEGEKLFAVNRKIMLTTETAMKDLDLFDFVANDSIASGMQNVVLVLHLLNEYSKKEHSYWWPYLSILPKKSLPILTLDKMELQYLLTSSHLFEGLKIIRAIARQYSYFYKRLQSTKLPLKKDFTFAYYAWGVSIVCSRQNEIPTADRKACVSPVVHALIPILDMCNHDRQSNQAVFQNNHSCLIASRDLEAKAEITINYGCRSSGEFFIHNGFVPDVVPFDLVPITITLNRQDELFEDKSKLLKILNMPVCGRFKLFANTHENRHRRDPHLTMFLIVYFLNKIEIDHMLTSQNTVGIADEIYEYVQYESLKKPFVDDKSEDHHGNSSNATRVDNKTESKEEVSDSQVETTKESNDKLTMIAKMKERLATSVKNYLAKRAAISVALIDRAVEIYCSRRNITAIDKINNPAVRLLLREKSVFQSYISES